jgi:hypothetical protein
LFADLEAQLDAARALEQETEVADRIRAERARVELWQRIRGTDREVTVHAGGLVLRGTPVAAAPEWLLLVDDRGSEVLVALRAVSAVAGLGPGPGAPETGTTDEVGRRLSLGYALRRLARGRSAVSVALAGGAVRTGTIEGVGAHALDLAQHAPGEARRADAVRGIVTIPFAAVVTVRPG